MARGCFAMISIVNASHGGPAGRRHSPTAAQVRRWRRYLGEERAEGVIYRRIAAQRTGEEREILLGIADAERRHEQHWRDLLGPDAAGPLPPSLRTHLLGFLARHFGSVFVLALMQRAEQRATYEDEVDATSAMAADERVHAEVVRALAMRSRARLSGAFRAAVFGTNDGLVSNLALVLGIGAAGVGRETVLLTGLSGLLAGALSMAAGEYVSVQSQRELLEASHPDPAAASALPQLDVDANELALLYRARGMSSEEAQARASGVLAREIGLEARQEPDHEEVGTGRRAAFWSFCFFALGALIPVLPWIFGMHGTPAVLLAAAVVGVALLCTGAIVGILSGASPLRRALRQIAIGYGAAAVTYLLGLVFGTTVV